MKVVLSQQQWAIIKKSKIEDNNQLRGHGRSTKPATTTATAKWPA